MFLLLFLLELLLLLIVFLFKLLKLLLLFLFQLMLFLLNLLLLSLPGFPLSFIGLLPSLIDLWLLSLINLRLLFLISRPVLPLFDLRRPLRIRIVLFHLLPLLDLLLLDPLALLVLFGTQILKFLLVLLFELRVDGARIASVARIVRARRRRPVVVAFGIARVCGSVARRIAGPVGV